MTPDDFRTWLQAQQLTQEQAADALGMARSGLAAMLAGTRPINRRTELACAALAAGLDGWQPPNAPPAGQASASAANATRVAPT